MFASHNTGIVYQNVQSILFLFVSNANGNGLLSKNHTEANEFRILLTASQSFESIPLNLSHIPCSKRADFSSLT